MKPVQLLGAALLVVVIVGAIAARLLTGGSSSGDGPDPVVVKGFVGGEKENFLADPEVQSILKSKYGITVDGTKAGSIEMVRDLALTDEDDFLWPSNQVALALYKEKGGTLLGADNIFNSPIVLYSWAPVVDALVSRGIATQIEAGSYSVDLAQLVQLVIEGSTWSDLGVADLHGRVTIHTTDPAYSNSGNMFSGLMANVLNGGDVVNLTTLPAVLPTLQTFYTRLGYMEQSSGDLFQQYLTTGMGAKPIIAGYESQLLEFSLQNENLLDQVRDSVRILYPSPTVWSSHPLIARTADGLRLMNALKDPEIQRLAWEKHGFRTGLVGIVNDPKVLQIGGIPAQITSVIDMPAPDVMDRIIQSIRAVVPSTPTAAVLPRRSLVA